MIVIQIRETIFFHTIVGHYTCRKRPELDIHGFYNKTKTLYWSTVS